MGCVYDANLTYGLDNSNKGAYSLPTESIEQCLAGQYSRILKDRHVHAKRIQILAFSHSFCNIQEQYPETQILLHWRL